jgi:RHS repeat-associated protein
MPSVAKHCKLDSFGNITSDSATGINERFAFTGVMLEISISSTWNRKRWFNTEVGQWKSEDPAKDGVNWHDYVGNHPTYATDPRRRGSGPARLAQPAPAACANWLRARNRS